MRWRTGQNLPQQRFCLGIALLSGQHVRQPLLRTRRIRVIRAHDSQLDLQRLSIQAFGLGVAAVDESNGIGDCRHRICRIRMIRPQDALLDLQVLSI